MRRFATFAVTGRGRSVDVGSVPPRQSPALCARRSILRGAARSRAALRVARSRRARHEALVAELVELQFWLEHGDVDGDDAGEQDRDDRDPDDAAGDAARAVPARRARPRPRPGRGRRASTRAADAQVAMLRSSPPRAGAPSGPRLRQLARPSGGRRFGSGRSSGSWPQTQTGKSGGQVHPRSRRA